MRELSDREAAEQIEAPHAASALAVIPSAQPRRLSPDYSGTAKAPVEKEEIEPAIGEAA